MNSTSNAVEDLATRGSESVLMLDEIGALHDKKGLGSLLFALSSGSTKARKAGRGAGLTERQTFRPYVVLSSENDLKGEIAAGGDSYRGGLAGRFADVDVTKGAAAEPEVIAALDAVTAHFGHAGPAFIQHLIATRAHDRPEALSTEIKNLALELAGAKAPAVMRRAAEIFAYPLKCGLLAVEAGLIGAEDRAGAEAAVRKVVAWAWDSFVSSGGAGIARGGADLIDSFRSFIAGEIGARIIDVSENASAARGGQLLGWYDDEMIYLVWAKLDDPGKLGLDFAKREDLVKTLQEAGLLVKRLC